ncbi:hypothetical protein [Streptomyces profundus]|uniref:hypothetical protein n=1 Tax=Streptomyces profundus TaxID=2867410 RepID=UPI001D16B683|nr:hypothetical protein [Streptomyces sp. MA3_2.13]UED84722.1 hypothetical protein K4G22_11320 [Streptomyces sp. MA3_2.13]
MPIPLGVLLLAFAGLFVLAFLRGYLTRRSGAGSQPATPHAGFATPQQLRDGLSEAAVRRAGAQVRPGLVSLPKESIGG